MKKGDALRLGAVMMVLILSIAVFSYAALRSNGVAERKEGEPIYLYMIKEYNGNIAVYKTDEQQPTDIYEVPVETLPEEDVDNLKTGIPVKDEAELQRLIEDLTS